MSTKFFELKRVEILKPQPGEFQIATAAILSCGLCGRMIDGMGGPGNGAICESCGNELIAGRLVGAVKWENTP